MIGLETLLPRRRCLFTGIVLCTVVVAIVHAEEYRLPCSSVRGRLMAKVTVDGKGPYAFLLDTCLQNPVLDTDIAAAFPAAPQAVTPQSQDAGLPPVVQLEGLSFAGIPPHPVLAPAISLKPIAARLGENVQGVLPLFQPGLEATLNFSDASVLWRSLDAATLQTTDANTIVMTIDKTGAPTLPVLINGRHLLPLQIDIARAGSIGLPRRTLESLGMLKEDAPKLRTVNDGGRIETQIRLETAKAAGAILNNPVCSIIEYSEEPGWIGLGFLRHFRLTFNFEFGLVRLENRAEKFFEDAPIVGCGLAPGRWDGQRWQLNVAELSPAWRAGVRTGDVLIAVGDHPIGRENADRVAARLTALEGTVIQCTVARGGAERTVEFTCERLL